MLCISTTSAQAKETSVLQLAQAFEEVNNIKIPYEIVVRRPEDIASVFEDIFF